MTILLNALRHTKTAVHIPNALYEGARGVAHEERTTVKALLEEGLRRALAERKDRSPFKLRKATFTGKGLQPEFSGSPWEQIRSSTYQGRGG